MSSPALRLPFDIADTRLHTERMLLRPLDGSDASDVYEYQRLAEVLRYIPWPERTRDEGRRHTEQRAAMRVLASDGDAIFFAMVTDGQVIGDLMVRVTSVQHAQLEAGWVMHPRMHGQGFATEATRALIDWVFATLNPHRIHASLDARNHASARLCERLGMRREAHLREHQFVDGEWTDTLSYALLRSEWP